MTMLYNEPYSSSSDQAYPNGASYTQSHSSNRHEQGNKIYSKHIVDSSSDAEIEILELNRGATGGNVRANSSSNNNSRSNLNIMNSNSQSNFLNSENIISSSAHFNDSHQAVANYQSAIEAAILRSTVPIDINETEEISVNGERGIFANRSEVANWRGTIPVSQYEINQDPNPEIITKRSQQTLTYVQETGIRYLRPPTPPQPGDIVIVQQENTLTPPAPPVIIRQQPARPETPEPLVIREVPPQPPAPVGRKLITISGRRLPPPPRKVVVERLAPLPSKPQSILIERWLPYNQVKRRVIFQRASQPDPILIKPRNIIVQWEAPQVQVKREFKYLGVVRANPAEYVQRYGNTLKTSRELPPFVLDIKTPDGLVLAADTQQSSIYELEGDVEALKYVDLDKEGLSEYRAFLSKLGISYAGRATPAYINASSESSHASASGINYSSYESSGLSRRSEPVNLNRSSSNNINIAQDYGESLRANLVSDSNVQSSDSAFTVHGSSSSFNQTGASQFNFSSSNAYGSYGYAGSFNQSHGISPSLHASSVLSFASPSVTTSDYQQAPYDQSYGQSYGQSYVQSCEQVYRRAYTPYC
jgi:hypothetical protein